jgi:hypothetical protein
MDLSDIEYEDEPMAFLATSGPKGADEILKNPLTLFTSIFDQDIIDKIVSQTNKFFYQYIANNEMTKRL